MADAEIPTVNIAPWLASDSTHEARRGVVEAIRNACITYGFFQLVGHGVPQELQQKVLQCAEDFFSLPMDEKMVVSQKNAMGKSARGYEVLQGQTLQSGALPDLKEVSVIEDAYPRCMALTDDPKGYFVGPELSAQDPRAGQFLQGPNLWPESLHKEDFEAPLQDYRQRMVALAEHVLQILARGLPQDDQESLFDDFMDTPSANLRLLHYPPQITTDKLQLGGMSLSLLSLNYNSN
jgi:isopenicillin N synthase-like dioxygenase